MKKIKKIACATAMAMLLAVGVVGCGSTYGATFGSVSGSLYNDFGYTSETDTRSEADKTSNPNGEYTVASSTWDCEFDESAKEYTYTLTSTLAYDEKTNSALFSGLDTYYFAAITFNGEKDVTQSSAVIYKDSVSEENVFDTIDDGDKFVLIFGITDSVIEDNVITRDTLTLKILWNSEDDFSIYTYNFVTSGASVEAKPAA